MDRKCLSLTWGVPAMREVLVAEREVHMRPVKISTAGQDRLDRCEEENLCPHCLKALPEPPHTVKGGVKAGIHTRCWQAQQRLIDKHKATKPGLIRDGKRRNDKPPGPPSTSAMAEDFAEAS